VVSKTLPATSPPTQTFRHPGRVFGKMVINTRFLKLLISEMMMFSMLISDDDGESDCQFVIRIGGLV
jgi:hypothetical protein